MTAEAIRQVRSFNRTVAERIGALDDRFLQMDRPLGEARLIWEIGAGGAEVRELRARLGIDSGYLSRVLRALERQGLVEVRPDESDRRVRRARLTDSGAAEWRELDRRSDALAAGILDALSERQRAELTAAMARVQSLLEASMVAFAVEDPDTSDARWCLAQYHAELTLRFENGFDPSLATPALPEQLRPPRGMLLIARLRGRPVGCAALKLHHPEPAELKKVWIAPQVRGMGVGRRLLAEIERLARDAGAAVLRLDTNRALTEAISLYRRAGYTEVRRFNTEPYAHHWFEKRLQP